MAKAEQEEVISNIHIQTKQLFFTQRFHVALLLLVNGASDDGGVETQQQLKSFFDFSLTEICF